MKRPRDTASIVPTTVLTMWRMKASASIQKASTPSGSSSHSERSTRRSKRVWRVWVGVKAVKSWVPATAAAQRSRAPRSRRWGQYSARPRSNGLSTAAMATR